MSGLRGTFASARNLMSGRVSSGGDVAQRRGRGGGGKFRFGWQSGSSQSFGTPLADLLPTPIPPKPNRVWDLRKALEAEGYLCRVSTARLTEAGSNASTEWIVLNKTDGTLERLWGRHVQLLKAYNAQLQRQQQYVREHAPLDPNAPEVAVFFCMTLTRLGKYEVARLFIKLSPRAPWASNPCVHL